MSKSQVCAGGVPTWDINTAAGNQQRYQAFTFAIKNAFFLLVS